MHRSNSVPKLLVVTSRRVGNAPERNRVRRRIKALFHERQPLSHEYDCAVIVKKPALLLTFSELCGIIADALRAYA
jgi:ribonuclease P protein component